MDTEAGSGTRSIVVDYGVDILTRCYLVACAVPSWGRRIVIALVAHAVAIVVSLPRVVNVRAVIRGLRHTVPVGVGAATTAGGEGREIQEQVTPRARVRGSDVYIILSGG